MSIPNTYYIPPVYGQVYIEPSVPQSYPEYLDSQGAGYNQYYVPAISNDQTNYVPQYMASAPPYTQTTQNDLSYASNSSYAGNPSYISRYLISGGAGYDGNFLSDNYAHMDAPPSYDTHMMSQRQSYYNANLMDDDISDDSSSDYYKRNNEICFCAIL